jgi:hypothetical protein
MRTLVCGESSALVVVVNEAYRCDKDGLLLTPAKHVSFEFTDLPWLTPEKVERVMADRAAEVYSARSDGSLKWRMEAVYEVALFRITGASVFAK